MNIDEIPMRPGWSELRMIREAVETIFGPMADLESEEATLFRGPELHHEAEAIVDALIRLSEAVTMLQARP